MLEWTLPPAPTQDPLKASAAAARDNLAEVMTTVASTSNAVEAAKESHTVEAAKPKGCGSTKEEAE